MIFDAKMFKHDHLSIHLVLRYFEADSYWNAISNVTLFLVEKFSWALYGWFLGGQKY